MSYFGNDCFGNHSFTLHELHERLLHGPEVEHTDRRLYARQGFRVAATGGKVIKITLNCSSFVGPIARIFRTLIQSCQLVERMTILILKKDICFFCILGRRSDKRQIHSCQQIRQFTPVLALDILARHTLTRRAAESPHSIQGGLPRCLLLPQAIGGHWIRLLSMSLHLLQV